MSERKTIQINPDLFKFSEKNTSRKKQPKTDAPKIKMKTMEKKHKQKTLRKNVLKMIREKQQEEYKRLFDKSSIKVPTNTHNTLKEDFNKEFNKDFSDSLDFFASLSEKQDIENQKNHNNTFKKYPNQNIDSLLLQPTISNSSIDTTVNTCNTSENVNNFLPESLIYQNQIIPPSSEVPFQIRKPLIQLPAPPKYGCLKNGSLPTYRSWHNQTQRVHPSNVNNSFILPYTSSNIPSNEQNNKYTQPMQFVDNISKETFKYNPSEISQRYEKNKEKIFTETNQKKIKYLKRKKIFKRTYHVGRSSTKPQIGVLVSNRTIRNRISTQSQLLKQTPIQDVRKFLIKKGFIRVGTYAPNDVLRKMYESVSLVCGEIQNHNPENLLFNFIHDK